jgi:hypothetical protein
MAMSFEDRLLTRDPSTYSLYLSEEALYVMYAYDDALLTFFDS